MLIIFHTNMLAWKSKDFDIISDIIFDIICHPNIFRKDIALLESYNIPLKIQA